jgi:hypothetical protein
MLTMNMSGRLLFNKFIKWGYISLIIGLFMLKICKDRFNPCINHKLYIIIILMSFCFIYLKNLIYNLILIHLCWKP